MNQKKVFISIFVVLILGIIGYFALVKNQTPTPQTQKTVFVSQEECEQKTNKSCSFQMCDYVPPGKTFEEVCGKDFKKGWVPLATTPNPPVAPSQTTEEKILEVTLEVTAPFSTAKLTIYQDGSALYFEKRDGQAEKQGIYEEVDIETSSRQMKKFLELIQENNFFSMKEKPKKASDPEDGSTYTITIKIRPAGPPELVNAAVLTVSCYQFSCEPGFLEIQNEMRTYFKSYWGKEVLEVGV